MQQMPQKANLDGHFGRCGVQAYKYLGSQQRSESLMQSGHKAPFCDRITISLRPGYLFRCTKKEAIPQPPETQGAEQMSLRAREG